ncbi:MAG: STAS domain-containing protein [Xanthomonadales bacterium]|nr:STAS domain-containing protein [Xanthomonadales bacterium]
MTVLQEPLGPVLVLAPDGRLDASAAVELERLLDDRWEAGHRHFVLDLAATNHVSSSGLRVLLALAQRLDGGAGTVRLCALVPPVRKVFDTAGFSARFAIFPDRCSALDAHPHRLEAAVALVETAAGLLGAGSRGAAVVADRPRAEMAAALLGATAKPAGNAD